MKLRVFNGQIDIIHQEIPYIGKLVCDPNSMGCCLNGFVDNFVFGAIYILIEEYKFFCKGAEYGCSEDECFVLGESIPRDS